MGGSENAIGSFSSGSPVKGIVTAAVVGGTASAIGGGKFANGAVSGAFVYLFNKLAHEALNVAEESTLVVYSTKEQTGSGNGEMFSRDMAELNTYSKGRSRGIDLDKWDKKAPIEKFLKSQIGDSKYDNLLLCAHAGADGIANKSLRTLFDANTPAGSAFLGALKPYLTVGKGYVFTYSCYDGIPTATLKGLAVEFGRAVYSQGSGEMMMANGYTIYPLGRNEKLQLTRGLWSITNP